jgi:hypothetical protein
MYTRIGTGPCVEQDLVLLYRMRIANTRFNIDITSSAFFVSQDDGELFMHDQELVLST